VIYVFEGCSLDTARRELRRGADLVPVEPQVFDILQYLIIQRERVVSKEDLIDAVWGGRFISESTLSSRLTAVRHAIGDRGEAQRLIRTVPRKGFRFVGEVREVRDDPSAQISPVTTNTAESVAMADGASPGVAEKSDRDVVFEERKHVTVLCADVKQSLELVAERDPEQAMMSFDTVLELMTQAVNRYEGTVNVVTGEGIIALFGVPVAHEDHAVRACYAALQIREALERYAERPHRSGEVAIRVRAGLNSGEVVVRSIGRGLHTQCRAMGQTMHVAARLGQMADPGTFLVSADTLRLAEGHVQVKAHEPSSKNGLGGPVYELVAGGPVHTRFEVLAARGLTDFVGRGAEMGQLARLQARAHEGHGQVVTIIGEAGLGKSRLLHEYLRSQRALRWLVLETASVSYRKTTSYLPVIELLRSYFKIAASDDVPEVRNKVAARLLNLNRALSPYLPALLALLDIPVEEPSWHALEPLQRRQRTLDALKHLILREARQQPVILAFEDLHWIDSETQALLEALVDSLPFAPVLLILTYRPEYEHHWGGKSYYTQFRLNALSPEATKEFLRSLLSDDVSLVPLMELLPRPGNPLFLEESIRTLVETNVLEGERGAYRLVGALPRLLIAPTVQAILAARIDRLHGPSKRLLHAASVVGKDVPYAILAPIAGLEEDELHRRLAELREAEFLYEMSLFPDVAYTFKHALTHDVAYGSLLAEERKKLHRRIVDVIEHLYPDRLNEHVEQLAHHAVRGEVWDKAVLYLQQAADKAAGRSAHRIAVRYVEEALVALTHVSPTSETTARAIDFRFAIRNWLFALGEHARIRAHLEDAQRLAEASKDVVRLAWASVYMSNYFWREGDPEQAITLGRRALVIADEHHDAPLRLMANLRLGQAYHGRGAYEGATTYLRENVVALQGELNLALFGLAGLPSVFSRAFLVWSLAELGEFREGIAHGEEAIRIADASRQMYSRAMAHFVLGFLHLQQGEPNRAASTLKRGLAIQESGEILALRGMLLAGLGHAHTLSGRIGEALPLIEQSVEQSIFVRSPQHLFPFLFLGKAYLEAGRTEQSAAVASQCLDLCRTRRDRGSEAWSLSLIAEIGLRRTPLDAERALERWREALTLATDLGMRPLVAHCHLGLGKLYYRAGKRQEAHEYLTTAKTMYGEMDMKFWLERAVPEVRVFE
jgi:class 3 adenylate cyclase